MSNTTKTPRPHAEMASRYMAGMHIASVNALTDTRTQIGLLDV